MRGGVDRVFGHGGSVICPACGAMCTYNGPSSDGWGCTRCAWAARSALDDRDPLDPELCESLEYLAELEEADPLDDAEDSEEDEEPLLVADLIAPRYPSYLRVIK